MSLQLAPQRRHQRHHPRCHVIGNALVLSKVDHGLQPGWGSQKMGAVVVEEAGKVGVRGRWAQNGSAWAWVTPLLAFKTHQKTPGSPRQVSSECRHSSCCRRAAPAARQPYKAQPAQSVQRPWSLITGNAVALQATPTGARPLSAPVVCSSACRRWLSVSAARRSARPSTCRRRAERIKGSALQSVYSSS